MRKPSLGKETKFLHLTSPLILLKSRIRAKPNPVMRSSQRQKGGAEAFVMYPKSWKLFVSMVSTYGADRQCLYKVQRVSQTKLFARTGSLKKDQDEGLECLCALNAGCFLHCGSAIKPLLLCGCSQTSPLHPCTASTGDFHEKKTWRFNSLPPSGHFRF